MALLRGLGVKSMTRPFKRPKKVKLWVEGGLFPELADFKVKAPVMASDNSSLAYDLIGSKGVRKRNRVYFSKLQGQIVRIFYREWKLRKSEVITLGTEEVKARLKSQGVLGTTQSIGNIFKKHPIWGTIFNDVRTQKGVYEFGFFADR